MAISWCTVFGNAEIDQHFSHEFPIDPAAWKWGFFFRVWFSLTALVATEDVEFQVGPEGESFFGLKAGCVSGFPSAATSHSSPYG